MRKHVLHLDHVRRLLVKGLRRRHGSMRSMGGGIKMAGCWCKLRCWDQRFLPHQLKDEDQDHEQDREANEPKQPRPELPIKLQPDEDYGQLSNSNVNQGASEPASATATARPGAIEPSEQTQHGTLTGNLNQDQNHQDEPP